MLAAYGYEEMRVPVVEHTDLFKRAIGEYTDVVEKEMYTFTDQGGDSLTLRPEATAGMVRAAISNGLLRGARLKVWCQGPMFRHEKPQKGRYRQFNADRRRGHRIRGSGRRRRVDSPHRAPVEVVRPAAREAADQFAGHARGATELSRAAASNTSAGTSTQLDADSKRRLEGNPLRILDSKIPPTQAIVANAPVLTEHLDAESQAHFAELRAGLDAIGVPYTVNPRLVRGLDYYSRTVFEWITDALGAQDAVCSGGRYDGLIAQLGGEATPAIGFAMGVERVVELTRLAGQLPAPARRMCS